MDSLFDGLTVEQKCAVMGFAVDFAGIKIPTDKQMAEITDLLVTMADDLGVSKNEVESFVHKMEQNGRLLYAINVLKTIEKRGSLEFVYCYFYSVVAILNSHSFIKKLNDIYKKLFGFDDEDIEMIFDLFEIKRF